MFSADGETDEALVLLDAHVALLANASLNDAEATSVALLRAELMAGRGRRAEARAVAERVVAAGASVRDPLTRATAAKVLLETLDDDLRKKERRPQRQAAIAALEGAVTEARALVGLPDMLLGIVGTLNDALVEDERATDAEALLRNVLRDARGSASINTWLLLLQASYHAVRRKDNRQTIRDLVDALQLLGMALWRVALEGDPVALLAPNSGAVTALTHMILHKLAPASPAGIAGLLIAADLRSAPMLTPHLR